MWKFSEHGLWSIIWVAQTLKNGLFHQKSSNRNWSSGNCSYLVEKSMVRIQTARPQWPKALIRSSERSMTCPKERGWNLTEVRPATWERPENFMNSENLWFARSNVLIKSARSRFCGLLTCPMLKCCWMWDFSHFHAISARPKPYRVATLAEDWYEDLQKKPRIMFAIVTMRQWNMAMENLPFIDDFPISISIVVGFPPLPCSITEIIIAWVTSHWSSEAAGLLTARWKPCPSDSVRTCLFGSCRRHDSCFCGMLRFLYHLIQRKAQNHKSTGSWLVHAVRRGI